MLDQKLQLRINKRLEYGFFHYSEENTHIVLNTETKVSWLEDDSFFYDLAAGANLTKTVYFVLDCDIFTAVEIARVLSTRVIPKLILQLTQQLGYVPKIELAITQPKDINVNNDIESDFVELENNKKKRK